MKNRDLLKNSDLLKKVEDEFAKYGLEPIGDCNIKLFDIAEVVRARVAEQLFDSIQIIVAYAGKTITGPLNKAKSEAVYVNNGVHAIRRMTWQGECLIYDSENKKLLLSFNTLGEGGIEQGNANLIQATVLNHLGEKIFSADYKPGLGLNPKNLEVVADDETKKLFPVIVKKANEIP